MSSPAAAPRPASWRKRLGVLVAVLLAIYLVVAYVVLPIAWKRYVRRHPALENLPDIAHTAAGIPGDPLNVALVGSETEVKKIVLAAGWYPADPLTLRSCLGIAAASVLKRPYDDAPVSNLYLWDRKEDLAFEQPAGDSPRKRHHVRFWRSDRLDDEGRPLWVGSATYDERVGLSRTTGQITHHIAPDVDAERDRLFDNLQATGQLAEEYAVDGFHKTLEGRNGGGDPWRTDGRLRVGAISVEP